MMIMMTDNSTWHSQDIHGETQRKWTTRGCWSPNKLDAVDPKRVGHHVKIIGEYHPIKAAVELYTKNDPTSQLWYSWGMRLRFTHQELAFHKISGTAARPAFGQWGGYNSANLLDLRTSMASRETSRHSLDWFTGFKGRFYRKLWFLMVSPTSKWCLLQIVPSENFSAQPKGQA